MSNTLHLIVFSFGLVYSGFVAFLAWFSPTGFEKYQKFMKGWAKVGSLSTEEMLNFMYSTRGFGLWSVRIGYILLFLLCLAEVILDYLALRH